MSEQKRFATPSSGRTWKKGRRDGHAWPDDDEMIPMVEGGKGGGGTDLSMWLNDEGKWEQKLERDLKDERVTQLWGGGRIDRRNETAASGLSETHIGKRSNQRLSKLWGSQG